MVKKLLKCAGALLGVALVLFLSVVPASAADVSSSNTQQYHTYIPFRYMVAKEASTGKSISFDWPVNSIYLKGTSWTTSSFKSTAGNYSIEAPSLSYANGSVSGDIWMNPAPPRCSTIDFVADPFVIRNTDLVNGKSSLRFGVDGDLTFRYQISFTLGSVKEIGNKYKFETKAFSEYGMADDLDIIATINRMSSGSSLRSTLTVVSDLVVSISRIGESADADEDNCFYFSMSAGAGPSTFGTFMTQFDMPHVTEVVYDAADPEELDLTTWLAASLGSVLDFEIYPGFSISRILWLVFTLGVLFWFLHITK